METGRIKYIILDKDGVLAQFLEAAYRIHGRPDLGDEDTKSWYGMLPLLGMGDMDEFWELIEANGHAFWANLKPYPWALDLVHALEKINGAEIYIATIPTRDPFCSSGKRAWIDKYFPRYSNRLVLTAHKWLLAAPDRLLIDDNEDNVEEFMNAGGQALLFPRPWNDAMGDWKEIAEAAKLIIDSNYW